ncbi:hypothetical protein CLV36_10836 [Laceyella sediminis]|uniref:Reverse transcriptase (RNA-dependent DNA polymerase) n=1 Tax=Laceyella sediminis TaxID=573074 RepID=A0ABX5EPP2_9BACL|nr:hypothetical protein CLV36_10836 [Laceyella sediminis]
MPVCRYGDGVPVVVPVNEDALVLELFRMLLEAIYEPHFSLSSHGFRPHRSCHTSLLQIKREFTKADWLIKTTFTLR